MRFLRPLVMALSLAAAGAAVAAEKYVAMPDLNSFNFREKLLAAIEGMRFSTRSNPSMTLGEGEDMEMVPDLTNPSEKRDGSARVVMGMMQGQVNRVMKQLKKQKRVGAPFVNSRTYSFAPFYSLNDGVGLKSMGDSRVQRFTSCNVYTLNWPPFLTEKAPETAIQAHCWTANKDANAWVGYYRFPEGTGTPVGVGSPSSFMDTLGQNSADGPFELFLTRYAVDLPPEEWPRDLPGTHEPLVRKRLGLAVPEHEVSFGVGVSNGDSAAPSISVYGGARFFDKHRCAMWVEVAKQKVRIPYNDREQAYLGQSGLDLLSGEIRSGWGSTLTPIDFVCSAEQGAYDFTGNERDVASLEESIKPLRRYAPRGLVLRESSLRVQRTFNAPLGGATRE